MKGTWATTACVAALVWQPPQTVNVAWAFAFAVTSDALRAIATSKISNAAIV
jgi:hypothetical protein